MPHKKKVTSVRLTPDQIAVIDKKAGKFGFASRSKYLTFAALTHAEKGDDAIVAELSRITFQLHQLSRTANGHVNLLKKRDIASMRRHARNAMIAVIGRNRS